MTQEEKTLLFQDLSARLPYHVRVKVWLEEGDTEEGFLDLEHNYDDVLRDAFYYNKIVNIKPYLRPLSSMTKDEKCEFQNILSNNKNGVWLEHSEVYDEKWEISVDSYYPYIRLEGFTNGFNWLNKKMFDYRGLIPMGLAFEAPEGMYNNKN